jgi:Acyl-CoA reductase (LuxC)
MSTQERIKAFVQLGHFLEHFAVEKAWVDYKDGVSQLDHEEFSKIIEAVKHHNGWFTPEMVRKSIAGIRSWLKKDILENWVTKYTFKEKNKTVAVIMAGNIPLVGFHDVLCVLLSGNKLMAKFSSDDDVLMPLLLKYLVQIEPAFDEQIRIANQKMTSFDAVIATGSNNSARYFESYFGKYPHIIRKNRTSVAILDGSESEEELRSLGHDVFDFYGLGCRNVTKVYVPEGYDLNNIFGAFFEFKDVVNHKKYANNYDYHKAIYMMNQDELIENGFIVLKEDKSVFSPIGMMHYEYYPDVKQVMKELDEQKESIQCIVGKGHVKFGNAQEPKVDDYADGVDTMEFLTKI